MRAVANGVGFPDSSQPLVRILAQRLQQAIALGTTPGLFGDHHRLSHQPLEQVERVWLRDAPASTHLLGGFEGPAASKHRQVVEQALFRLRQQVIAPVQRGLERLLAGQSDATAAGEQAEALVEPGSDLIDGQRCDARRRELQGQWDAVQALADLRDCARVALGNSELRLHRRSSFDQQPNSGILLELRE